MEKLAIEKKSAIELQKKKHEDWIDNHELYRNKVKTNRLTQRQAVNIPLMKETIKTLLSKIDDAPNVDWSEKAGDEEKELIYQEGGWKYRDRYFTGFEGRLISTETALKYLTEHEPTVESTFSIEDFLAEIASTGQ